MIKKLSRPVVAAVSAAALCVLLFSLPGCDTISKIYHAGTVTVSESTATTLIVDAEKATQIGNDTMDTFLKLEYSHRPAYAKISPKIHEYAAWLRAVVPDPSDIIPPGGDGPQHFVPRGVAILKTARMATKTFKANRTPENEANLRTALATVQSIIENCKKYTTMALADPGP